jgi:uncharacterized DUF497 family protein
MNYEWDESKRHINLAAHGLDFDAVVDFDWDSALVEEDIRREYHEKRYVALGLLGERLTVLVFTVRGLSIRVISFRTANQREVTWYEAQR